MLSSMTPFLARVLGWAVLMLVWAACILYLNLQFVEPLTGRSPGMFAYSFVIILVPMGIGLYLLFVRQAWRITGGILVGLALLLVFPFPSMPGIEFSFDSARSDAAEIIIRRADKPDQFALVEVPAGRRVTYVSAPGDWPEDLLFSVECFEHRLTTNAWTFRTRTIRLDEAGLSLVDRGRM